MTMPLQQAFQPSPRHAWMTGVRALMSREDIVLMMYLGDAVLQI